MLDKQSCALPKIVQYVAESAPIPVNEQRNYTTDTYFAARQGQHARESGAVAHTAAVAAQQQQSSKFHSSCMQPALADPKHPDALFKDRDGSNFSYILGYLRNVDQAVLLPDLYTTPLVLLEARFYQLTGLIGLLQKHEAQLQQAKCQQQQLLQQTATGVAKVAGGIAEIKKYVSPRRFNQQTLYEASKYDEEYQGDCEAECMVADMAAALHKVLKQQLRTMK